MLRAATLLFLPLAVLQVAAAAGNNATSQPITPLPTLSTCSQECLAEAMPYSGCTPTDAACLCTSKPFTDAAGACLAANCTVVDALTTQRYSSISCGAPVRNDSATTRIVCWTLFAVATICIAARFLSRLPALRGSGFSWDDHAIFISYALLFPADITLNHMSNLGLGQDIWMLPDPNYQISQILYHFWISEYIYVVELSTTKIAILLLYLRMWPTMDSKWFHYSCWILIATLSGLAAILVVVLGLQCQPVSLNWTRWDGVHEGNCVNLNALIYATSGVNILLDILVILLPIPRLLALSIPNRKKVAVCVTFCIGLFVTFCSIIRLRSLAVWGSAPNLTWLYNPIAIWSNVELNLGVVCACVPALAGLLQRLYVAITGKQLSLTGGRTGGSQSQSRTRSAFGMRGGEEKDGKPVYEMQGHSIRFSDGNITLKDHPTKGTDPRVVRMEDEEDRISADDESRPNVSRHGPLGKSQEVDHAEGTVSKMIDTGYSAFQRYPATGKASMIEAR